MYKVFIKERKIFHLLIIAMFTLGLSACGYKAPPFYLEESHEDDDVKFILNTQDSNKSQVCEKEK